MTEENRAARQWLQCRNLIAEFLTELRPDLNRETQEHNAAAIIARLSHAGYTIEPITNDA